MLAVIATPAFDPAAAAWLAAIRAAHDPLQDRVGPHVTLMFPVAVEDEATLRSRLQMLAIGTAPFAVAFDRLGRMEDPHQLKYRFLNVLLPDAESGMRLDALHRAMTGAGGEYVPHLTISRFGAVYCARALERQLGPFTSPLRGRVAALELLRLRQGAIRQEACYALAQA
jgi:2'-5' RNA ligase